MPVEAVATNLCTIPDRSLHRERVGRAVGRIGPRLPLEPMTLSGSGIEVCGKGLFPVSERRAHEFNKA